MSEWRNKMKKMNREEDGSFGGLRALFGVDISRWPWQTCTAVVFMMTWSVCRTGWCVEHCSVCRTGWCLSEGACKCLNVRDLCFHLSKNQGQWRHFSWGYAMVSRKGNVYRCCVSIQLDDFNELNFYLWKQWISLATLPPPQAFCVDVILTMTSIYHSDVMKFTLPPTSNFESAISLRSSIIHKAGLHSIYHKWQITASLKDSIQCHLCTKTSKHL